MLRKECKCLIEEEMVVVVFSSFLRGEFEAFILLLRQGIESGKPRMKGLGVICKGLGTCSARQVGKARLRIT